MITDSSHLPTLVLDYLFAKKGDKTQWIYLAIITVSWKTDIPTTLIHMNLMNQNAILISVKLITKCFKYTMLRTVSDNFVQTTALIKSRECILSACCHSLHRLLKLISVELTVKRKDFGSENRQRYNFPLCKLHFKRLEATHIYSTLCTHTHTHTHTNVRRHS